MGGSDKDAEPQIINKASFQPTNQYILVFNIQVQNRRHHSRIVCVYTTSASFNDSRYLVRDKLTSVSELRG